MGLKGALEQQNIRYGKTSHISARELAGRQGWVGVWGGDKWRTGNGLCVRDDVGEEGIMGA